MKNWLVAVMAMFLLTACGDEKDASPEQLQKTIDEGTAGFEMLGGKIQEATGVPEDENKLLMRLTNTLQPLMIKIYNVIKLLFHKMQKALITRKM